MHKTHPPTDSLSESPKSLKELWAYHNASHHKMIEQNLDTYADRCNVSISFEEFARQHEQVEKDMKRLESWI